MSPFINTAWPRFFTVALPIALFAVLLNSMVDAPHHGWLIQTALLLAPFSILVFLGLGWQRMRKAHAEHPILKSELPRVATALIGNVKLAALWFGLTFVGMFTLMLAWVLLYRSCS
ncbi:MULTISPECIES: hypothetical protein [Stenotrophomonas]|uniref:Transmembrane protein n=1 Tax=Stenotrophomonas maltophilia TaxID=40324 RepID=A0AAI9BYH5_STEMA|nr:MULTISPECIES: hypothetical protein [Stenotrophomonas]UUS15460.1 hypothetical protein NMB32_06820 [Stenotrophomonas sp. CD2]AWT13001.1 hypothetical protein DM611_01205 [Stenotrophomonas maltophilia]EKT4090810.1 hypothetical protein [Stenotrophomonas maltophilia]MBA0361653.1 hypothetical protein [Stenotrophomonas maltophilia]MBA0431987.1 hypothetical protein [Stenotrophomonas maltophilia]